METTKLMFPDVTNALQRFKKLTSKFHPPYDGNGGKMCSQDCVDIDKVWRWYPVCMSSQIFERRNGQLQCTNRRHQDLLKHRKDSWVRDLPEWQALHQRS